MYKIWRPIQYGFSLFELLVVISFITFLLVAIHQIINAQRHTLMINQTVNYIQQVINTSTQYINTNYRQLQQQLIAQQEVVLPMINKKYPACLYITITPTTPTIYLMLENNFIHPPLNTTLDMHKIIQAIGVPAAIIPLQFGQYVNSHDMPNSVPYDTNFIQHILGLCHIAPITQNNSLLFFDLTNNSAIFNQIQLSVDKNMTASDLDPSLKQLNTTPDNQATLMHSNLYLDHIVQESTANQPAQHVFNGVYFATPTTHNISLQADANSENKLIIANAGIEGGYLAPTSQNIIIGTACRVDELGTIAQQGDMGIIRSQVQCTYSPTACQDTPYCYLSVKTASFMYHYAILQAQATCPRGTVVDGNQPPDGINTQVVCPNIDQWMVNQGVHGQMISCYNTLLGSHKCNGYQAICTYINHGEVQQQEVPAIAKLQCTNDLTIYTIENYTDMTPNPFL